MLSAGDYGADLAERYGSIQSSIASECAQRFRQVLAHRIAKFPAAGLVAIKDRVNAIALAPTEDFRRDSDLFGWVRKNPRPKADSRPRSSAASRPETRKWSWRGCWTT
jgi:hypothetical protein